METTENGRTDRLLMQSIISASGSTATYVDTSAKLGKLTAFFRVHLGF